MSHVKFKKWPGRRVEFSGPDPYVVIARPSREIRDVTNGDVQIRPERAKHRS